MPSGYSTQMLFKLWHDNSLPTPEVAYRLGVTQPSLYRIAGRHKLPKRVHAPGQHSYEPPVPSEADELLSGESLAFSPWVAARIKELGLGVR